MKLTELKTPEEVTFRDIPCRLLSPSAIVCAEGRIVSRGQCFEFIAGFAGERPAVYPFVFEEERDAREIAGLMQQRRQNLACAACLPASGQEGRFRLHIVFFFRSASIGRWTVVTGSGVEETLRRKGLLRDKQTAREILEENFRLSNGVESCFAYTVGKYDPEEFARYGWKPRPKSPEEAPEEEAPEGVQPPAEEAPPEETANGQRKIRIYGRDFSLQLCLRTERSGREYLLAESVDVRNRRAVPMALGVGQLCFEEGDAFFSESIRRQLDSISGYLDLWNQYTGLEGDFLLRRAREMGTFFLHPNCETGRGGVIVYPDGLCEEQWAYLTRGTWLCFSQEPPPYLEDTSMTWQQYRQQELAEYPHDRPDMREIVEVRWEERSLTLDNRKNQGPPPAGSVASLSILGDERQISRREDAQRRIDSGEAANPALGLIIEGCLPDMLDRPAAQKPVEPMSTFVKEKIFGSNDPTPAQAEAIRIALNTPDIAIIQGPPGTGKTKVITAIIERLNELADPRRNNQGSVLVTSFQHAAVRNICERLWVNSLLTMKFGSQDEEDRTMEQGIEAWCANYAQALRDRNPSIRISEEQKRLKKRYHDYFAYPGDDSALRFLEQAEAVDTGRSFAGEIEDLKQEIRMRDPDRAGDLTGKIRRLRTTREGFLDDGQDTAYDLLRALEDTRDLRGMLETLERASLWEGEPEAALLEELARVREELLRLCVPKPVYRVEKPRSEIIRLYQRLSRTLQRPKDEMDAILSDLLYELENNSVRIEKALERYNFVYAATTQQCEGQDIRRAKGVMREEEHPEYPTVIVDEAARVSPGNLMIPMAQASRRIILVGDHRQLPHIYDEEIFESMAEQDGSVNKDVIKMSMFQYLIEKARELTKQDGIPRTITLDAQYRTHPLLGEFVSRNFYEPYHEAFASPSPGENYRQELWHKPVKWVDFPPAAGPMKVRGTSKYRPCEADYIVDTLAAYWNAHPKTPEGKALKFGVIAFYREQCDQICGLLLKRLGRKQLPPEIQIGSVDAFQGMEFDVIFLSVVRCRKGRRGPEVDWALLEASPEDGERREERDRYRRKLGMMHYGFLSVENRLCVALSRQIRLLILVGDSGAFDGGEWGRLAQSCIPAMGNMVQLCKREEVLVDGQAESRQPV